MDFRGDDTFTWCFVLSLLGKDGWFWCIFIVFWKSEKRYFLPLYCNQSIQLQNYSESLSSGMPVYKTLYAPETGSTKFLLQHTVGYDNLLSHGAPYSLKPRAAGSSNIVVEFSFLDGPSASKDPKVWCILPSYFFIVPDTSFRSTY